MTKKLAEWGEGEKANKIDSNYKERKWQIIWPIEEMEKKANKFDSN